MAEGVKKQAKKMKRKVDDKIRKIRSVDEPKRVDMKKKKKGDADKPDKKKDKDKKNKDKDQDEEHCREKRSTKRPRVTPGNGKLSKRCKANNCDVLAPNKKCKTKDDGKTCPKPVIKNSDRMSLNRCKNLKAGKTCKFECDMGHEPSPKTGIRCT